VVFGTIVENVKSFFVKEDALDHQPKKVPDAAPEIFERPDGRHHTIVQRDLPPSKVAPVETPKQVAPKLPFTSEQLRQRLAAEPARPVPAKIAARPAITDDEIASQIVEFERAISSIPGEDGSTVPLTPAALEMRRAAVQSSQQPEGGFFSDFAQYLRGQGYQVEEGVLEEALSRMKLHHELRLEHEKHRERGMTIEESLSRKLAELQELERDWASKQEEIIVARDRATQLEAEIAQGTRELKELVGTMKSHVAGSVAVPSALPSSIPSPESIAPPQSPVPQPPILAAVPSEHPAETQPIISSNELQSAPSTAPVAVHDPFTSSAVPAVSVSSGMVVPAVPRAPSGLPRYSVPLPPSLRFHLHGGGDLGSIDELRSRLLLMPDAVFFHHVTPERNDFSSWILNVFHDRTLSDRVRFAKSRYELARLLPP